MDYDFCLNCGVLMGQFVYECPVCGFHQDFDQDGDIILDDQVFSDFGDEAEPEGDQTD